MNKGTDLDDSEFNGQGCFYKRLPLSSLNIVVKSDCCTDNLLPATSWLFWLGVWRATDTLFKLS